MSTFAGFTNADFDAYVQKKWKSNVFTRERLEVKQKLLQLGRELQPAMLAADGSPLACEASVEYPTLWNHKQVEAQHLYFSRNEGARKELDQIIDRQKSLASMIDDPSPQRNHVFLALSLSHSELEVSVKLHPDARVDRQNLERKCEDHFEAEKLVRAVRELGASWRAGITPELGPAAELDEEKLKQILGKLAQPAPLALPGTPQRLLYVGNALPQAQVVERGAGVAGELREALGHLGTIYRFIAWSRDNDFVSMKETLQKERQAKRQKGVSRNEKVRIVRGMFAGKSGVVQEIDAKGQLKVLVGKMAVKVDAADVDKA
jgi:transcription antitermination factor NusG